jgi:hypothetical protein
MKPDVTSVSEQLAARLDRAVRRARLLLVLEVVGTLLVTLVAAVAGVAWLDWWLRPERIWLGGSCVWLVVALSGWVQVKHRGLPAAWPTRISVARQWECSWPHLGSQVSSAVGFLTTSPAEQGAVSSERRQPTTADFAALAVEQAAQAVQQLPNTRQPAVVMPVLWLLAGGVCLATFGGLSGRASPAWRQAVVRQVPPAVGGWAKPAVAEPTGSELLLPPLTAAEISQVIRRLLDRLVVLMRPSGQSDQRRETTAMVGERESLATDARMLVDRLPAGTPAELLRWCEQVLAAAAAAAQPQADLAEAVAVGQAVLTLAEAAALERQLARQVHRMLPQQPGLRRDQLTAEAVARLDQLAETQQRLTMTVTAAAATLAAAEPRFPLTIEPLPTTLSGLLARNQLAAAGVGVADAAERLSARVAELGLLVPDAADLAASGDSRLVSAVVAVAAVEAELAASMAADPGTRSGALRGQEAEPVADQTLAVESAGPVEQSAAGSSAGGRGAGGAGGIRASLSPQSPAGPRWRLGDPTNAAGRRMAIDQTLPPETVTAFGEYLQRVAPRQVPLDVRSPQPRQALP